jgi:diphthamide biosynthesis enzyme Dph1/Dph2-like protein
VNASHAACNDLIVHFGKCCLSSSNQIKQDKDILYVLPKANTTIDDEVYEVISNYFSGKEEKVMIYLDIEIYTGFIDNYKGGF